MSEPTDTPDLSPDPGQVLWPPPDPRPSRSFVSGDPHGTRIRIAYAWDPVGENRVGKVWFGPDAEGPPGHAHGGAIAAVLDEAMGTNCWIRGHHVLAGTLNVVYRRPVPLRTVARITTRVDRIEGRKLYASGALLAADGAVFAEGSGIFVVMRPEVEAAMDATTASTGGRTPEGYG